MVFVPPTSGSAFVPWCGRRFSSQLPCFPSRLAQGWPPACSRSRTACCFVRCRTASRRGSWPFSSRIGVADRPTSAFRKSTSGGAGCAPSTRSPRMRPAISGCVARGSRAACAGRCYRRVLRHAGSRSAAGGDQGHRWYEHVGRAQCKARRRDWTRRPVARTRHHARHERRPCRRRHAAVLHVPIGQDGPVGAGRCRADCDVLHVQGSAAIQSHWPDYGRRDAATGAGRRSPCGEGSGCRACAGAAARCDDSFSRRDAARRREAIAWWRARGRCRASSPQDSAAIYRLAGRR
jgi:hypothetical protein